MDVIKYMNFSDILDVIIQICSAIQYIHLKGFVYGNLDIGNIYATKSEGKYIAKIIGIISDSSTAEYIFDVVRSDKFFNYIDYSYASNTKDLQDLGKLMTYLITQGKMETSNDRIFNNLLQVASSLTHLPITTDYKIDDVINEIKVILQGYHHMI